MMQARQIIAAFTLPVRPQSRKRLSDTGQKRKCLQQITPKTSKELPDMTHSFNIAIETVLFSEYYPHRSTEKSR